MRKIPGKSLTKEATSLKLDIKRQWFPPVRELLKTVGKQRYLHMIDYKDKMTVIKQERKSSCGWSDHNRRKCLKGPQHWEG